MTGRWFRWGAGRAPETAAEPAAGTDDRPETLLAEMTSLDRWVNRRSGALPGAAVVRCRWITDSLRETVRTSETRPLDIHAVLLVGNTVRDYLPTTLSHFLTLTEASRAEPGPAGALIAQLDLLHQAAVQTLDATRQLDIDALTIQGTFLRTRFTGSDLDL